MLKRKVRTVTRGMTGRLLRVNTAPSKARTGWTYLASCYSSALFYFLSLAPIKSMMFYDSFVTYMITRLMADSRLMKKISRPKTHFFLKVLLRDALKIVR